MRSESVMNTKQSAAWTKKREAESQKRLSAHDVAEAREIARDAWRTRAAPFNQCPVCKSSQVLYRLKTSTFVCRRCGNVWKVHDSPKKGKVKE